MNQIFSSPEQIKLPNIEDYKTFDTFYKAEDEYERKLKDYVLEHGEGKYKGEELRIPHADGYARYLVYSLKPVRLVHIDTGDAWHASQVEYMPAAKIKEHIDRDKGLKALFKTACQK